MPNVPQKIIDFIISQIAMILEPINGYSRAVSITKVVLLIGAFMLVAALIILPLTNQVNKNFRLTFSAVEKKEDGELPTMVNPHLQGVDNNDQTYNINAKSATQDKTERMMMRDINADIKLKDGGWVSLKADDGLIDRSKNILDLNGNITIINNEGYELNTSEAHADVKNHSIYGNVKITGHGPLGSVVGDSFSIENKNESIKLQGNVKLIIYPK